eukprot:GGOE01001902.1.p1 GENE.GGOE01001902.1~~GGOE01001902.1.p1  ORF type:complete len:253 (+),score=19.04 GGOE01001902.1:118-876(+)
MTSSNTSHVSQQRWHGSCKSPHHSAFPSPDNVLVQRVEQPLLDQASASFQSDLAVLLKRYLESHPPSKSSGKVVKRHIVADDDNEDGGESQPNKKPKSKIQQMADEVGCSPDTIPQLVGNLAPDVQKTGSQYAVTKFRQYILLPQPEEDKDWVGVFATLHSAKMNPGVVFSNPKHLLGPATVTGPNTPLCGSVDSASRGGGVGWFFHPQSGISIDGIRCAKSDDVPAFGEGDTIGLVIDLRASTAYLVHGDA